MASWPLVLMLTTQPSTSRTVQSTLRRDCLSPAQSESDHTQMSLLSPGVIMFWYSLAPKKHLTKCRKRSIVACVGASTWHARPLIANWAIL